MNSIETAPQNKRVLVYGHHVGNKDHDECGMGWWDKLDNTWYYSPVGGPIPWVITGWLPVPEI